MTRACRCGNQFEPRKPWQRFCSNRCRRAAFNDGAGEVKSLRQIKTGWSVVLHFKHQPRLNIGEVANLMRSGRMTAIAPKDGGSPATRAPAEAQP